jgi:hypothetical protein
MAVQPTIEAFSDPRYTDLVLWEEILPAGIYNSRDIATVTATTGGTFPMGAVIFRPKAITASAVWDLVDAQADIAITNDYAIVIGDDFEPNETVTFVTATPRNVIALARRARLKQAKFETSLKATFAAASATDIANLIRVLATQGILVEGSLTAIAP